MISKNSMFSQYRHFVIAFHDSVFEVMATGFEVETLGSISVVRAAQQELQGWERDD